MREMTILLFDKSEKHSGKDEIIPYEQFLLIIIRSFLVHKWQKIVCMREEVRHLYQQGIVDEQLTG